MDALIKRFDAVEDGDLMLCLERGVAYQRDMTSPIAYDAAYFDHYVSLEGTEIARRINSGRVAIVDKYVGKGSLVLDNGIGSGEFIRSRLNTHGRDVNQTAVRWLHKNDKVGGDLSEYSAFTFWDVLEHIDAPNVLFRRMRDGSHLFTCIPVMDDLKRIRESKHYKPNEHFYYWTEQGFVDWMALYRFRLLERQNFETEAGRVSIGTFAFKKDLPSYHDTLSQYHDMHAKAYGTSAHLYFDAIAKEVLELNPRSILDFGCGRSDLVAHFWKDGARRIAMYDPAIPRFKEMPEEKFELVICTDVMEHIPMAEVDRILGQVKEKSSSAIFTISMKPARAKLPDGRNAHVTLLNADEWTRWVTSVFGAATRIPTQWDHILMLRTY